MSCPTCTPVVMTSPLGDYIRTNCRECGETLPRDEELTPAQKGAITRAANRAAADAEDAAGDAADQMSDDDLQAVYDQAFMLGILEEAIVASGLDPHPTTARIDVVDGETVLIETIAGQS